MKNKKIITLLLAATVAITSVAPTVKASDIILVPSGNGGYTVSTATGSSVATATPVPTTPVTETPVSNSDEKRWYTYRGIKYWMNNASGRARVIDKCLCGKRVVKLSKAAIRKHIDECIKTDGHPKKKNTVSAYNVKGTASYVGEDVIETPKGYEFTTKDIVLGFSSNRVGISGLPVKKGTKVTFQLKGNRKYTTKVKTETNYYKRKGKWVKETCVYYDYDTTNKKCRVDYDTFHTKTRDYINWYTYRGDHNKVKEKMHKNQYFSNYKKAKKYMKKYNAYEMGVNYIGRDEVTIKIKGYGTYVFRVDFNTSSCGNSYKIADLRNK